MCTRVLIFAPVVCCRAALSISTCIRRMRFLYGGGNEEEVTGKHARTRPALDPGPLAPGLTQPRPACGRTCVTSAPCRSPGTGGVATRPLSSPSAVARRNTRDWQYTLGADVKFTVGPRLHYARQVQSANSLDLGYLVSLSSSTGSAILSAFILY